MRRLAALLLAFALGPLPAGAGGEAGDAGVRALHVRLELLDAGGAERRVFRSAESITLRITLKLSRSEASVSLITTRTIVSFTSGYLLAARIARFIKKGLT